MSPARANDPDAETTADVLTRARPEFDARGLRLGTFFFYPSLAGGFAYTDNVFNDATNVEDYLSTLAPLAQLRSAWARHELNLSASAKSYWYSNQAGENRTDWNLAADARIDIVRGSAVSADLHYENLHEPRGTDLTGGLNPGDPLEPTALVRSGFNAVLAHTFNHVRVSLGAGVERIDYDDTPVVGGGLPINNDDRDRNVSEIVGKVDIETGADTSLFIRGRANQYDFETPLDDFGFNHDSSGWTVDGGVEFSMTHVLVGELFAGYTARTYDSPVFAPVSELAFGAGLRWFPSMLTTIRIDAARSIEDTSITGASGYVSTRGELGLDHELLRNVILSGRLGYENAEYQEVLRNDDILRGSLAGRFLINNHLHFDASWEFTDRNSSALPFEYSTGQFQLSLTGKL